MSSSMTPPAEPPASDTWLTPAVKGFSAASFFSDFGHELATALIPGFLTALGAPPIALGLVEGVSLLAQSAAGLWGGALADQSPRRQRWVVVGYLATALKALMALVFSWPWIVVIRTVAWTGRGMRGPIRNTLLAEEVPQAHRGRAYGFREAWDTAGAVLGPVAALLLVTTLGSRTLLAWSAVPGALAVVVVLWWVRDHRPPKRHAPLRTAVSPAYRRGLAALAQFQVGWVAPTLFILRVERAVPHNGVVTAIVLYVVFNMFYAASAYPAGIWADKIGAGAVLWMAGTLGVLTLVGFALPGVHVLLWGVLFAAAGAVTAGWESARQPWMLRRMTPGERGRGFGRVEASLGVSQFIANVAVAGVWTLVGPTWAFALAALMAAQGTFSLWSAHRAAP